MQDRLFISKNEIKYKVVLCIHFYFFRNPLLFSSPLFITLISDMIESAWYSSDEIDCFCAAISLTCAIIHEHLRIIDPLSILHLLIREKTKAYEIIFVLDVLRKIMRFLRKKVTVLISSLLYYYEIVFRQ